MKGNKAKSATYTKHPHTCTHTVSEESLSLGGLSLLLVLLSKSGLCKSIHVQEIIVVHAHTIHYVYNVPTCRHTHTPDL